MMLRLRTKVTVIVHRSSAFHVEVPRILHDQPTRNGTEMTWDLLPSSSHMLRMSNCSRCEPSCTEAVCFKLKFPEFCTIINPQGTTQKHRRICSHCPPTCFACPTATVASHLTVLSSTAHLTRSHESWGERRQ